MHQSHNIPWHLISSNFEFKENDRRFTPPFSGLASKNNPNASQELNHFIRKFAHTIRTFSDTERAKYPDQPTLQSEGNVFSDELKEKYPHYLNDTNQRIEYWIQPVIPHSDLPVYKNGMLAEIVKILLYENELAILIMMARHPNIPIAQLHHINWNYDAGFSCLMVTALRAYMYFNAAEATNTLENGQYTHADDYRELLMEVGKMADYPAQQIPHKHFFESQYIAHDRGARSEREWAHDIFVHKDLGLLKEYLKTLFALLYRYDLLLRECAIDPKWELEIGRYYPIIKVIGWRFDHD